MICPKCGYQEVEGSECPRCGIVLARYRPAGKATNSGLPADTGPIPTQIGLFKRLYRVLRWIILAGLILVVSLMLSSSPPPPILVTPEATKRAEAKIEEFQSSLGRGVEHRLTMDEAELNGWLSENLALKKSVESPSALPTDSEPLTDREMTADQNSEEETLEQIQSSVRDVKIDLLDDSLRVYARFDFHGMELSLELEGKPMVRDGYLRLEPTRGKLGSLPLMAGTLKNATDRLFESPKNKEKFKLPPEIEDVRIEQGQLLVLSR